MNIKKIIYQLNNSDELVNLEAKQGRAIDRSILETVCAFSNEPDLGGGYIILGVWKLTNAGLIVFGSKMALRRLMPMVRVDYIRLPGKVWVENPDERFEETLDLRGPIIELVARTVATIADDLPKGFLLSEGSIQAKSKSLLPVRVLREAIDNFSYCQLTGANREQAGTDLRDLRKKELIKHKSAGKSTYYLPSDLFLSTLVDKRVAMVDNERARVDSENTMVDKKSAANREKLIEDIKSHLPVEIEELVKSLGKRSQNPDLMRETILKLCSWRALSIAELAAILGRNEKYIKTNYLKPLIDEKMVTYTITEMITHPDQKYRAIESM